MASEVAIAAAISEDMRQAALVAHSASGQVAGMDLREQWTSDAAAQGTLRRHEQHLIALSRAAVAADSLAQEAISVLLALQQAGK